MDDLSYQLSPWQYAGRISAFLLILAALVYYFFDVPREPADNTSRPTMDGVDCAWSGDFSPLHARLSLPAGWRYIDPFLIQAQAVDTAPPLRGSSISFGGSLQHHAPQYDEETFAHPSQTLRDTFVEAQDPQSRVSTEIAKLGPRKIGGAIAFGASYTVDKEDGLHEVQHWFVTACGKYRDIKLSGPANSPFPTELSDLLDSAQWVYPDSFEPNFDIPVTLLKDNLTIPNGWTYLSYSDIKLGFGGIPDFAIVPSEHAADWTAAHGVGIDAQWYYVKDYSRMLGVSPQGPLEMSGYARDHAFNLLQDAHTYSDLHVLADIDSPGSPTLVGFAYSLLHPKGQRLSCETWFVTAKNIYKFNLCAPANKPEQLETLRMILTTAPWAEEPLPAATTTDTPTIDSRQSDASADEVALS